MDIQSKACCTRPPVTLTGGYDSYELKGRYTEYNGLKTYETGDSGAKRGIFVIYDVFGLYIQSLKGADILAHNYDELPDSAGKFQVFMPDFFGSHPQDLQNFPPKTPKQFKAISDFMNGYGYPPKTVPLIAPILADIQAKHPEIKSWAIVGFCWGGKIASLVCQKGTAFKAAAQCHPSLLDTEDAKKVAVPMCVLPSQDEVPKVTYLEYFTDQVHGWMTSRADFNNVHNYEEYLRGYRIVRTFFAQYL
ncbi:uncharacterized protein TRIVIDRAFT_192435 [Trichoderma virens Gv29-8]|uniref:Dienelactone hydrolase domain-containing protein n=1 Tax=Hypocrea virens (strain Gv29-8 / FGSC 10586) TaxID=413071 RepID=G9MX04_HYPVG|nr:uncharacterized protein TRIVIDRAFT_192435 [Trichoderma virens Gv29-8]EHK20937.1 hypothetical protein TRIVIDRAFT_192435 [Trichoderma virens Gv29-8]UKZ52369.1 hypothetical protein TrVGV298_006145 [Trichoderma virens]